MTKAIVLLSAVLVSACSKDQQGPSGPVGGEKACTQMGCIDGLRISLEKATPWAAGSYAFAFDLDGAAVNCTGALPLKGCDAGPSVVCDVADRVQIGESGCAMPADTHGFADIQVVGGAMPRAVGLTISKDGQPLHAGKLTPAYKTTRPNGEGCEPTCSGATETVALP